VGLLTTNQAKNKYNDAKAGRSGSKQVYKHRQENHETGFI